MLRRSRHFLQQSKPKKHYDVCVIGGGPSGVAAALRAADYNKKVCLIEKTSELGGADAWKGALTSKALWEMSYFMQRVRSLSPRVFSQDVSPQNVTVCEDAIQETLTRISKKRATQM